MRSASGNSKIPEAYRMYLRVLSFEFRIWCFCQGKMECAHIFEYLLFILHAQSICTSTRLKLEAKPWRRKASSGSWKCNFCVGSCVLWGCEIKSYFNCGRTKSKCISTNQHPHQKPFRKISSWWQKQQVSFKHYEHFVMNHELIKFINIKIWKINFGENKLVTYSELSPSLVSTLRLCGLDSWINVSFLVIQTVNNSLTLTAW